jgi:hypothetical protein
MSTWQMRSRVLRCYIGPESYIIFFSVAVLGAHLYGDSGRMERNEAKIEVGCGDSALGSLL